MAQRTFHYTMMAMAMLTIVSIAHAQGDDRIFRLDPVALVSGEEVEGLPEITAARHKYTYWFASEENRQQFESEPLKYEIQMGGGCGRMGPLSGEGRTDLFAVHDRRIYIFASEGCRTGFMKNPDVFIERRDVSPEGDAAAQARAKELIERAVEGIGGAARLDSMKSFAKVLARQQESGGETIDVRQSLLLAGRDRIRTDLRYGPDYHSARVVSGDAGWFTYPDEVESMDHQQRRVLMNLALHHPVALLRLRDEPGFVAIARGRETADVIGGRREIELVDVHIDGATTTLGIDPDHGRILLARYRGRGPNISFGPREDRYGEFAPVDGLILAHREEVWFEGEMIEEYSGRLESIELDAPAHTGLFEKPAELVSSE